MNKKIPALLKGFTPVIDKVVADVGLMSAVVFGRIQRYCRMEDGVCTASLKTIGEGIGLDKATVMRHAKILCNEGYIKDLTPTKRNSPHVYADTGKVSLNINITVAESNATVAESNATVAESNATVAENQLKKVFKKDIKENEEEGEKFDFGMTYTFFLENFGAPRKYDKELLMDMCDEHTPHWTVEAMKIAVKSNARNLAYVDAVLKRWKVQGYGTERQNGKGRSNGKNLANSQAPAPDNYVEELEKKRARLRKQMDKGGKVQLPS